MIKNKKEFFVNSFLFIYKNKNNMTIKYNITIFINDGSELILPVKYDSEYALRTDITKLGISGVLQKIEGENSYLYFPPHKIDKIEVAEIK
jgi:hypothetical protein